jgi:hypothetical protein
MSFLGTRLTVGVVTVMVAAELDIATADAFHRQIRASLDDSCGGHLDLSDPEFCGLAGMRAIYAVAAMAPRRNIRSGSARPDPALTHCCTCVKLPRSLATRHHHKRPTSLASPASARQ